MSCPPEIASILLKILSRGLIRIRSQVDDPEQCFLEADHLHNLPELIRTYSPSLLSYYWNVERQAFMGQTPEANRMEFDPLWDELGSYVPSDEAATVR